MQKDDLVLGRRAFTLRQGAVIYKFAQVVPSVHGCVYMLNVDNVNGPTDKGGCLPRPHTS